MAETKRAAAPAPVPLVDVRLGDELERQIVADIADIVARGSFTNGPEVAEFEAAFARYCGSEDCVGVASGLDALRIGLLVTGVQPGDEVIVPALTFAATLEAVVQAGARPVLVDVREDDFNLDPERVAAALTPKTRFVIPVHLYGQLADMRSLRALALRHDLVILEDAAQAHGAARDGLRAGTTGAAGAFSFYPTKNLGAFGDAGALVTNDAKLAARARALREHGQHEKYEHAYVGYTARLDTIQAAVLLRKLPFLDRWNDKRRRAARLYTAELRSIEELRLPAVLAGSDHVWYVYVVRAPERDRLASFLGARGVRTGKHYPQPLHLEPAYAALGLAPGQFPVAERLASEVLSLPLFPGISDEQIAMVVSAVEDYYRSG